MPVLITHVCEMCGEPFARERKSRRFCGRSCFRKAARKAAGGRWGNVDPTPEQIAERCAAIRGKWTEQERLSRLRRDWRPAGWALPGSGREAV